MPPLAWWCYPFNWLLDGSLGCSTVAGCFQRSLSGVNPCFEFNILIRCMPSMVSTWSKTPSTPSGHDMRGLYGMWQGRAADAAGIHFRVLNASKGPAVRGPRAQMDRGLYKAALQNALWAQDGLQVVDGAVTSLLLEPCPSTTFTASLKGSTSLPPGVASSRQQVAGIQLASGN